VERVRDEQWLRKCFNLLDGVFSASPCVYLVMVAMGNEPDDALRILNRDPMPLPLLRARRVLRAAAQLQLRTLAQTGGIGPTGRGYSAEEYRRLHV